MEKVSWKRMLYDFSGCSCVFESDNEDWKTDYRKLRQSCKRAIKRREGTKSNRDANAYRNSRCKTMPDEIST